MACYPEYYFYFASQKIAQIYRQLPESCCVARKGSHSENRRDSFDLQLPPPEGDPKKGPYVNHIGQDRSSADYRECLFDKNDMYQLRQTLRALRREGRLCPLPPRGEAAPGRFYSFRAVFAAEDAAAAKQGILLRAEEAHACPALRLYCESGGFVGADGEALRLLALEQGIGLPLAGVLLCATAEKERIAGLPLFLSIADKI
ncbi:MAG: hypothetical protein LBC83_04700 [Oscillospiraceae bacterium]|nr:hypothetical protein [Oscillospiraceae bacterium]